MAKCCDDFEELIIEQDRLWADHYWHTREVIRDAAAGSDCLDADLAALYQNQKDLGHNFGKLVCSKKAGRKLTNALTVHIDIAVKIVVAVIKGKPYTQLYEDWEANGNDIACIYVKYIPDIRERKMIKLMQEHLKTTFDEAGAIIAGKCDSLTGKFALKHIRMMVDYIERKL